MRILWVIATLLVATSLTFAGTLAGTHVQGSYVEARTADVYTGPCFANSEGGISGELAVFGWKVNKGAWQGVNLDGLGVVGVVKASDTLGNNFGNPYPVKAVLIVDEKADAEQRLALRAFAQKMAGDLLSDIVRVEYRPVSLELEDGNVHSATATLKAGELAKVQTRAINKADHFCTNEEVWYLPLTKVGHAMPAVALTNAYQGSGLNTRWTNHDQRSAFVADFQFSE